MSRSKCLILCKSEHHGNTTRVAQAMQRSLGGDAVIAAPEHTPHTALDAYGLFGFGSGVYYGRMHRSLFDWLCGLPDDPEPTRAAFVFSTSGLPLLARAWHSPLKTLLDRKGFDVVAEFSCRGFDTWGPLWFTGGLNRTHPDERDVERAREFGRKLAPILRQRALPEKS